jgi:uncharacterized membrane protein YjgN (DUF898 family)
MNDMSGLADERPADPETAFEFTGNWREFLPIALTNLLLSAVTLGIYRFWAKARERRYLWSRTRFIDDHFEWTGTGREMFVGFLIVFAIVIPVIVAAQFGVQAMAVRGEVLGAAVLSTALYGGIFYLIGVGQFRALRYRLSRSWWHGIRGGSHDAGWAYGGHYVWKTMAGFFAAGLLVPWSMTSLWNDRWNEMSFGQHDFIARADTKGLIGRWLLLYAVALAAVGAIIAAMMPMIAATTLGGQPGGGSIATMLLAIVGGYLAFLLISLSYYAAFFRKVIDATSIAGIDFEFTARTKDWLKLILGNIALVIVTLGVGALFLGYRNWSFAIRHMEATGEINLDRLLKSQTAATGDAEGLADAFDIGAI